MNGAGRTLMALVAGLLAGAALKAAGQPGLLHLARGLAPIGELWLTALRMTLVPLIFALVVTAVGAWTSAGQGGRVVGLALGVFAALLALAAVLGSGLMALSLRLWPVQPGALAFLGHAAGARPAIPTLSQQLMSLIPPNPVAAAASGDMTPLVVFALLLGLALTCVAPERRRAVTQALQGVGDAMMVIVGWILLAAPAGVFVLALGVALNSGLGAAGVLAQAVVLLCIAAAVGIGVCHLIARWAGGVGFGRFARAALGPQAVAAGTCSSMATLPALLEAAERKLAIPDAVAGAVLPLAVSSFRFGNVIMVTATALFAACAAGLHPSVGQIALAGFVAILTNLGVAGLPAAAVLYAAEAPAFQALGAPLELLPMLIAVSAIEDVFDTTCNVTADLAATTVVERLLGRRAARPAAPEPVSA